MSLSDLNLFIESGKNVLSLLCQLTERGSVLKFLAREVAGARELPCYLWNLGQRQFHLIEAGNGREGIELKGEHNLPMDVLEYLIEEVSVGVFVLENLQSFLAVSRSNFQSQIDHERLASQIINVFLAWENQPSKYLILLGSQEIGLPPVFASIIPEVSNPLPCYEDNVAMLEEFLPILDNSIDTSFIPELALSERTDPSRN